MKERILTKSRIMEYLTIDGLTKMTGVPRDQFDVYVLKELIDNALDACELYRIPPSINVSIAVRNKFLVIKISDNAKGISEEILKEITNFERFGGTKHFVKKPTRGAQGNALMTILGISTVMCIEQNKHNIIPIKITSFGKKNLITLRIDNVMEEVKIERHSVVTSLAPGTTVKVMLPLNKELETWGKKKRYLDVLENFALWNPHTEIYFSFNNKKKKIFKRTSKKIKKYFHKGFGSIHWYTIDDFEKLLHANIRYLEEKNRKESIINFAKHFKGCSSNKKGFTKQLIRGLPKYLNDIRDEKTSEKLFLNMKSLIAAPNPGVLGEIGREHLYDAINRYKVVKKLFKYKKIKGDHSGIPFVLETAIGPTEKLKSRKIVFGINNTITYRLPFEADLFFPSNINERDKPWQKIEGLDQLLYSYKICEDDPVMIAMHLISPNIRYENYGKSTFETGGKKFRDVYYADTR